MLAPYPSVDADAALLQFLQACGEKIPAIEIQTPTHSTRSLASHIPPCWLATMGILISIAAEKPFFL